MTRKITTGLLLILAAGLARAEEFQRPPNVVLILIDDLGYGDIGPFGNKVVSTPNLDALAAHGRKFTEFYASPVCTMSRASLLTGCYNRRISMPAVLQPNSTTGLNPAETNMANLLKKDGYAVACLGKWHLGHLPEFLPLNQGFETYFGIPYSNNMTAGYMKGMAPPLPLYDGDKVVETEPDQSQFTRRFTERAIDFITDNKDQRFFLYLAHPMIHQPRAASAAFKGKSKLGLLGDAIEEFDWSVGRITKTLGELGLANNTLVIFTSDNGPDGHAAGELRGVKGSTFEGGVRVPTIMSWPGRIPAGTTCSQIAASVDLLPTIADLAGTSLDPARPVDGLNISDLLFKKDPGPVRETQIYYGWQGDTAQAIRHGKWKLFLGAAGNCADRNYDNSRDNFRVRSMGQNESALYDLELDPDETTDLRAKYPEIVDRLTAEAKKRDAAIQQNARPIGRASDLE